MENITLIQFKTIPQSECRSGGEHCRICRNPTKVGDTWRIQNVGQQKFDCPYGLQYGWERTKPTFIEKAQNAMVNAAAAAVSTVKTTIGINVASSEQVEKRLLVCKTCPSKFVVLSKDGAVLTCGNMVSIMEKAGEKPCGCILGIKARDTTQTCPVHHWDEVDKQFETTTK